MIVIAALYTGFIGHHFYTNKGKSYGNLKQLTGTVAILTAIFIAAMFITIGLITTVSEEGQLLGYWHNAGGWIPNKEMFTNNALTEFYDGFKTGFSKQYNK